MKKISILIASLFLGLYSYSQSTLPFPIQQSVGSDSTLLNIHNAQARTLIYIPFTDTTAANSSHAGYYNGAIIATNSGQSYWYRYNHKWYILSGMGSTPSLQQVTTVGDTTNQSILLTDGLGNADIYLNGGANPYILIKGTASGKQLQLDRSSVLFTDQVAPYPQALLDFPYRPNSVTPDSIHLGTLTGTIITHVNGNVADSTGNIVVSTTGSQNLQQVTDIGNSTTDPIVTYSTKAYDVASGNYVIITPDNGGEVLVNDVSDGIATHYVANAIIYKNTNVSYLPKGTNYLTTGVKVNGTTTYADDSGRVNITSILPVNTDNLDSVLSRGGALSTDRTANGGAHDLTFSNVRDYTINANRNFGINATGYASMIGGADGTSDVQVLSNINSNGLVVRADGSTNITASTGKKVHINNSDFNTSGLQFDNFNSSTTAATGKAIGVDGSGNVVTLNSTSGTVTTVSTTNGYGIISSVANPNTTPNITIKVDSTLLLTKADSSNGGYYPYTSNPKGYLSANQSIIVTATGDATGTSTSSGTAPSLPLVLATVNSNIGTFGSASSVSQVTVNAKGLTTAASSVSILIAESQVTNLVSDLATKKNIADTGQVSGYTTRRQTDSAIASKGYITTAVTNVSGVNTNGFTWSIANPSTTPALTLLLQNSTTSQSGQLTSTDWNTFNSKQSTISLTTNNRGGVSTLIGNTFNIPNYVSATGDSMTYLNLPSQSVTPSAPAMGIKIFADASNRFSWINAAGYTRTLRFPLASNDTLNAEYKSNYVIADSADVAGKQTQLTLTTTGTSGVATLTGGALNIPNYTVSSGANPTASVGLSTVNGSATTFMRSDAAPALSQSIVPVWTGLHTFQAGLTTSGNQTASFWGTTGINISTAANVIYTDNSSSGSVGTLAINSLGMDTVKATNATTYSNIATLVINGTPIAGTNVTGTNLLALDIINGKAQLLGGIFSGTSSSAANFLCGGNSSGNPISTTGGLFSAVSVANRVGLNGSSSTTLAVNGSYGNLVVYGSPITTPATGTNLVLAQEIIQPLGTVTSGGAAITNTATLLVNGQSTAGTNNYDILAAGTKSRFDGIFNAGGTTLTGNQVWGANNGATAMEGKTVTAGSNITVTNTTGVITIAGSGTDTYLAKTGNYSAAATDQFIDYTSTTSTLTLPTAVGITGKWYIVKNSGTGTVTIATTSSQTIDGLTTKTLSTQYSGYRVESDGANWKIISSF